MFFHGQHYSLAAALSKNGYITTKVVPGSFDSYDFFDFVAEQVVCYFLFHLLYLDLAADPTIPLMGDLYCPEGNLRRKRRLVLPWVS